MPRYSSVFWIRNKHETFFSVNMEIILSTQCHQKKVAPDVWQYLQYDVLGRAYYAHRHVLCLQSLSPKGWLLSPRSFILHPCNGLASRFVECYELCHGCSSFLRIDCFGTNPWLTCRRRIDGAIH